jgi:glycosyltransferase involved in cell wall biosynthesis
LGPVVYLTSQYPAASHTFIEREIAALRDRGLKIETATIRPCSPDAALSELAQQERANTFSVLPVSPLRLLGSHLWALVRAPTAYLRAVRIALGHRPPGLAGMARSLFYFAEAMVLARHLVHVRARRLHNHFANPGAIVGMLASDYLGMPWSLTLHGTAEFDYPAGLLLARKLEAATDVVCASYFIRAQAMRLVSPAFWDKFTVVRCGVPLSQLDAIARESADAADAAELRLVCVARLSPEKGHTTLFRALARIDDVPVQLTLVGEGPQAAALHDQARRLGVEGRIVWAGQRTAEQTLRTIRDSDVLVLASFMEGLPVVLMEALALHVPVIAPCVAGIPELVRHEETGLLFTVGRDDELAAAIRRLAEDHDLRRRLGARGREFVVQEFSAVDAASPLLGIFDSDSDSDSAP